MRAERYLTIFALSLGAACGVRGGSGAADQAPEGAALRAELKSRPSFVTPDAEGRRLWQFTKRFYDTRGHEPAWTRHAKPLPQLDALVTAISAAGREGLDPELYSFSVLRARLTEASRGLFTARGFEPDEAGRLDVWLTYLYMKFASDLADGLSDLAHADPAWRIPPEKFDPLAHLERALDSNRVAESLHDLTPQAPQYHLLRSALARHRAQAERGPWPVVPSRARFKPGRRSTDVAAVARRLAASGDYAGPIPDGPMEYGLELRNAVRQFQRRHGLEDDGIVGPAVVTRMNVPLERRIGQIELNLERWRWLPRDLGNRYLLVNIPAYTLEVREGDDVALAMRVVVGKRDTPTPVFSETMTHLVFSPYWNVPPDIAREETLPAIMRDATFLDRANMEVVDADGNPVDPATMDLDDPARYRFRQRPGATNSLGLVKFMFPNEYNVYLHDTPADSLFARASRSFSHGCVRVEDPEALAAYLLQDQSDWDADRIRAAMHAGEERTVKIRVPLPVYLGYWTAAALPDGTVSFMEDVYGIDDRQSRMLAERLNRLKKATSAGAQALQNADDPCKRCPVAR